MNLNMNYKNPKKVDYMKLAGLFVLTVLAAVWTSAWMSAAVNDESGLTGLTLIPFLATTICILSVFLYALARFIQKK